MSSNPQEFAQTHLEPFVRELAAADEPHRRHAEAVLGERVPGRFDRPRVVGEPQVVVGAEVDAGRAALEPDFALLGRRDDLLLAVQAVRLQALEPRRGHRRRHLSWRLASTSVHQIRKSPRHVWNVGGHWKTPRSGASEPSDKRCPGASRGPGASTAPADPPDSRNVPPNDGTGTLLFTASRRAHRRRFPVPG